MSASLFWFTARDAENRCHCFHISEIQNKPAICVRFLAPTEHSLTKLSACLIDSPHSSHFITIQVGFFNRETSI